MSESIFDKTNNVDNNIQRHSFDWRHSNFFSARIGYLYPVITELVPANSSLKIDANMGMQFMPLSYPLQTRLKSRLSFFKVPLRILWKDYMDYVGNFRKDLEEPYHDFPDDHFDNFFGECKLGDYLDIPNVVYTNDNSSVPKFKPQNTSLEDTPSTFFSVDTRINTPVVGSLIQSNPGNFYAFNSKISTADIVTLTQNYQKNIIFIKDSNTSFINNIPYTLNFSNLPTNLSFPKPQYLSYSLDIPGLPLTEYSANISALLLDSTGCVKQILQSTNNSPVAEFNVTDNGQYININISRWNDGFEFRPFISSISDGELLPSINRVVLCVTLTIKKTYSTTDGDVTLDDVRNIQSSSVWKSEDFPRDLLLTVDGQPGFGTYKVITLDTSPYFSSSSNPDGLKLNAYRARAYECVYNSYYRDSRNNPLYDDQGNPVYNKWLLNYDGGADTTKYEFRRANWEKDFLTTAVHSPQQGQAPLVGLTQYITESPSTDGSNLSYNIALVDESGKKYKVTFDTAGTYNGAPGSIEVSELLPDNTPVSSINFSQLVNSVNYGISIPDLRAVNAYQKFLELNIRKGYSYKDIIEGRFDCKVRYDELLMPEFLGGFTRDITMNRVVQSIDTNVLTDTPASYKGSQGALSGDAFLNSTSNPQISVFCDEECIVMGILSVVPQPAYNQLLPKDFLYRDLLDHFNPEFNHLGFQPIKYAEVCPLQCKEFGISPDSTFGYQRPWYEYVAKTDKVHGLLRTTHRDFIMNRNFNVPPVLNESFLLVDDNQLNDVFQVTDESDKIIGQIDFFIQAELPISRVSIPRLD